jgi:PKD repeat protein
VAEMIKITNTKVVLLAFLILVGMIVSPVSAYTQLGTWDYNVNGVQGETGTTLTLQLSNDNDWKNVTYMTFESKVSNSPASYTDYKICNYAGNGQVGTVDFTIDGTLWELYPTWSQEPSKRLYFTPTACGGDYNLASTPSHFWDDWYQAGWRSTETYEWYFDRSLSGFPYTGEYTTYGGSNVIAPVAAFENVAHPKDCYYPSEYVDFIDESTNTPTSWTWGFYNDDLSINLGSTDQNPGFTIPYNAIPQEVSVILCAENSAGEDCEDKTDYITVGATGECMYNTTLNITPEQTLQPIPTAIPNYINMTQWRNGCTGSALGNATEPYCNAVDDFSNVTNATFNGIIDIFTIPLDWITLALTSTHENIDTLMSPLIQQSSVLLALVGRALAALPAVFINIVTLGLLIDVVRIVLRGKGGE